MSGGDVVVMPGVSKPSAGAHSQPVEHLIDTLAYLLMEAEQGRLRAAAIAYVAEGGIIGRKVSCMAPEAPSTALTAALSILHTNWNLMLIEGAETDGSQEAG